MTTTLSSIARGASDVAVVLAALVGALVFGYGLLLVPLSPLGGLHVAAIGLSLALAGVVATDWARERFNLSPGRQRALVVAFVLVAVFLLVAFAVLNVAFVESGESFGGGGSASG